MENKETIKKNLSKTLKYIENYLFVNSSDYFEIEKVFIDDKDIGNDSLYMVVITVELKYFSDNFFDDIPKELELVKTKINELFYKILIDETGKITKETTNEPLFTKGALLTKLNYDYYEEEMKLTLSYFFE